MTRLFFGNLAPDFRFVIAVNAAIIAGTIGLVCLAHLVQLIQGSA